MVLRCIKSTFVNIVLYILQVAPLDVSSIDSIPFAEGTSPFRSPCWFGCVARTSPAAPQVPMARCVWKHRGHGQPTSCFWSIFWTFKRHLIFCTFMILYDHFYWLRWSPKMVENRSRNYSKPQTSLDVASFHWFSFLMPRWRWQRLPCHPWLRLLSVSIRHTKPVAGHSFNTKKSGNWKPVFCQCSGKKHVDIIFGSVVVLKSLFLMGAGRFLGANTPMPLALVGATCIWSWGPIVRTPCTNSMSNDLCSSKSEQNPNNINWKSTCWLIIVGARNFGHPKCSSSFIHFFVLAQHKPTWTLGVDSRATPPKPPGHPGALWPCPHRAPNSPQLEKVTNNKWKQKKTN